LRVVDRNELFAPGSFGRSHAHAINEDGDICGSRYPADGAPGVVAYLLDRVASFDEEGNVISGTFVDRPLKHLVETRRESTRNYSALGLNNSNTPQLTGSAFVYQKSTGNIVRNDFPVIWQGTSVTDVQKLVSTSSPIPSYYMPAINDLRWLQRWPAGHGLSVSSVSDTPTRATRQISSTGPPATSRRIGNSVFSGP
jgi:hypothetical protein